MKSHWFRAAVVGAVAQLTAAGAFAADLPPAQSPVYKAPAAAAPVWSWTGFYIGASVGAEWMKDPATLSLPAGPPQLFAPFVAAGVIPAAYQVSKTGVIGTFQAGYNWQFDRMVLGAEADISGPRVNGTQNIIRAVPTFASSALTYQTTVGYVGTVRGRLGVLLTPRLLAYATGGLAYGSVSHLYSETQIGVGVQSAGTSQNTETGWTAGGGLEWAVADNVTLRGEYLYVRLSSNRFTTPSNNPNCGVPNACSFTLSDSVRVQMARFGVNYKF
jgi:outer membrane immunogenic protein